MPGPTGPSPKLLGVLGALLLACVFAGIIWFTRTPTNLQQSAPDLFPDASDIPGFNDLQSSGKMLVTMTDKQDPTRVASTLAADRFEPIGEGQRRLDRPVAWIYQRDGRAVKIEADFATVVMPDPNQPPEAGTLTGNVRILAYESTPSPGEPAADDAVPTMITRFEAPVEFERQYLRLRSEGRLTVHSDQIDFAGEDLTIMLNEVKDRIELIDIRKGEQLVFRRAADETQSSSTVPIPAAQQDIIVSNEQSTRSSAATADTTDNSIPLAPAEPAITRYHIAFADDVLARVIGTGSVTADSLDIWALLADGKLRDNAIAQVALSNESNEHPATIEVQEEVSLPASPSNAPARDPVTITDADPAYDSGELVITWEGPLTVKPLEDDATPQQLASSDLAIELNAAPENTVRFEAPERGLVGSADNIVYYATPAVLTMHSDEQDPSPTEIVIRDAGMIRTNKIEASLASGSIKIDSAGMIRTNARASSDDENESSSTGAELTWKQNAAFDIAVNDDGSLSNRLEQATFEGVVQGIQDGNKIAGSSITASFDPSAPQSASLRKLRFLNGAIVSRELSSLGGDVLDIDFAAGSMGHSLDPTRVAASGSAFGRTPDDILRATELTATLARDPMGKVFVRTADARNDVRYTGKNRTSAQADSFTGDGSNKQFTLLGTPGNPATTTQGGSTITGERIDLNARDRSLVVPGAGTFDHDVAIADDETPGANGHLRVRWAGSMRFDDALGMILCEESVTAISTPDAYTKDTVDAHRIEIDISPMPIAEPIRGRPLPERKLLEARAYGRAAPGQDPIPAKIESRTYAENDPERVIGLLYLEGPQIFASNTRQTLAIPAPGTLLVMDRTQSDGNENASSATGGQGITRFDWRGRMDLDRAAGNATMRDGIVVGHKSLSDGQTSTLTTDLLQASFELASQSGGTNRLLNADAIGAVHFSAQTRELLADRARFDAENESIFASGDGKNLVTLHDRNQPAPVSARTLLWDLARDRVEINAPSPVRTPSGP